jgi:hypothetical protein
MVYHLAAAIDFNNKRSSGIVTHVIVEANRYFKTKPIGFHSGTVGLRSSVSRRINSIASVATI